jgi:hypothetical protein
MAGARGQDPEPADGPGWHAELEALTAIGIALDSLPPDGRERALRWAVARWGPPLELRLVEEPHPHG